MCLTHYAIPLLEELLCEARFFQFRNNPSLLKLCRDFLVFHFSQVLTLFYSLDRFYLFLENNLPMFLELLVGVIDNNFSVRFRVVVLEVVIAIEVLHSVFEGFVFEFQILELLEVIAGLERLGNSWPTNL